MTSLDALSPALALEVDALCDDYERHRHRSRRRGNPPPEIESFVNRATPAARSALRSALLDLERDLLLGVAMPEIPGLILEEEIGRGGMGVVYRARREEDSRPVALKLIPGEEHARWSRWMAEIADLRHPNLVPLEAFGSHGGLYFVVMPLVAGGDLKERLREFVIAPDADLAARRRVAELVARVADAVGLLHGNGIAHRDLKPSNVLLTAGPDPEPLVCDFGLAVRLGSPPGPPCVAGTLPYAAPEQLEGQLMTAAADVWSLGAVLHELLTGSPPGHTSVLGTTQLDQICRRCLCHDPAERYPSAADLAHALRAIDLSH